MTIDMPALPSWMDDAACAQIGGGGDFFTDRMGPIPTIIRRLCGRCPVKAKCLDYALDFEGQGYAPSGVYGGVSAAERVRILRERRATSKQEKEALT